MDAPLRATSTILPVSVWARGAPPVTHLDNSEGADRWGLCHQVLLRHQVVPPAPHETKGPPQSEDVEYRGGGGNREGRGGSRGILSVIYNLVLRGRDVWQTLEKGET